MSRIRRLYFVKLIMRIIILLASIVLYFTLPRQFEVVEGMNFFSGFSVFHVLWLVWVIDMVTQLFPVKNIALGSQKQFKDKFRPVINRMLDVESLKDYIVKTNKSAGKVLALWGALLAVLGTLKHLKVIDNKHLLLVSITFYVCDLICVLIWCPFRLIMGNKCCTTCRIFNWDHLMMFTPLMFVGSFFALSLLVLSFVDWLIWEICVYCYPERFWEHSNMALKCSECTDKLCTQYCRRLRK